MKLTEVNGFDLMNFHEVRKKVERDISIAVSSALRIPPHLAIVSTGLTSPRGVITSRLQVQIEEEGKDAEFTSKMIERLLVKTLKNHPSVETYEVKENSVYGKEYRWSENQPQSKVLIEFIFTLNI